MGSKSNNITACTYHADCASILLIMSRMAWRPQNIHMLYGQKVELGIEACLGESAALHPELKFANK